MKSAQFIIIFEILAPKKGKCFISGWCDYKNLYISIIELRIKSNF